MQLLVKQVQMVCKIVCEFLHVHDDIVAGVRYHTANSEPSIYDASYNQPMQLGAIPIELNDRCVTEILTLPNPELFIILNGCGAHIG